MKIQLIIAAATCLIVSCSMTQEEAIPAEKNKKITYSNSVQGFITQNCIACHNNGMTYIHGGDLSQYDSLLVRVNKGVFRERLMVKKDMPPYPAEPLSKSDSIMLQTWLDNGMPFD